MVLLILGLYFVPSLIAGAEAPQCSRHRGPEYLPGVDCYRVDRRACVGFHESGAPTTSGRAGSTYGETQRLLPELRFAPDPKRRLLRELRREAELADVSLPPEISGEHPDRHLRPSPGPWGTGANPRHAGIETTQRYARLCDDAVMRDATRIREGRG